jgi:hypothetical protein
MMSLRTHSELSRGLPRDRVCVDASGELHSNPIVVNGKQFFILSVTQI